MGKNLLDIEQDGQLLLRMDMVKIKVRSKFHIVPAINSGDASSAQW